VCALTVAAEELRPSVVLASNPRSSVLVVDPVGAIFSSLRDIGLSVSLWRVLDARRLPPFSGLDLAILAVYDHIDWAVADVLTQQAPTLAMTTTFDTAEATASLGRGLIGYLDASLSVEALRRALTGALKGEPAYGRDITGTWLRSRRAAAMHAEKNIDLTPRQRQIVTLIARGATDKEIAGALGIATATAQKHVTNILERLNVPNRAAAVAAVAGRGVL
jgi:DNA-binding NarL/FixJ family response regulator